MSALNVGALAMKNRALLDDVREHDKLAFRSAWRKHDEFVHGSIQIIPSAAMCDVIKSDYAQMQDMMFGQRPSFDWILERMKAIDAAMNTC